MTRLILLSIFLAGALGTLHAYQDDPPPAEEKPAAEKPAEKKDEGGGTSDADSGDAAKKDDSDAADTGEKKETEEKTAEKGDGKPLPEVPDEAMSTFFDPDVDLEDYLEQKISVYLLLLAFQRANSTTLDKMIVDDRLSDVYVSYAVSDATINRVLSRMVLDKKVSVQKPLPGFVLVTPYGEQTSVLPGQDYIEYFIPDIELGRVLPGTTPVTELLRGIAREQKANMVVGEGIGPAGPLSEKVYTLNHLLNQLVYDNVIWTERDGGFVYVYPLHADGPSANRIVYDYQQEKVAFSLRGMPLRRLVRDLVEITGQTVLLDASLSGIPMGPESGEGYAGNAFLIVADQGLLPFQRGLESLLQANGMGLNVADGVFTITPRAEGIFLRNNRLDIWVRDRPLGEVIGDISAVMPETVIVLEKLEGTISIDLQNATLGEILELMLADTQYSYQLQDGVYMVGTSKLPLLNANELVELEKVHAQIVYDKMLPEWIKKDLTISVISELNSLLISGQSRQVYVASEIVRKLDRPVAQVLLEVIVVKYSVSDSFELGLTLTADDGSTLFPNIGQSFEVFQNEFGNYRISQLPANFTMLLNALENKGKAKTIMKPKIAALSGNTANITISESINYKITETTIVTSQGSDPLVQTSESIQETKADVKLEIVPYVMDEETLTVAITPTFATFNGMSVGSDVPSGQSKQSLESTVRLRSGETIILGGMVTNTQSVDRQGIPYLSRIPLLGALFRNRSKSTNLEDMIIYVTPHIYIGDSRKAAVPNAEELSDYKVPTPFEEWKQRQREKKKKRKNR